MSTILIMGASGTIGHTMMRVLSESGDHQVWGSVRSELVTKHFPDTIKSRIKPDIDVENFDAVARLFADVRPDVVINCIGLVKQLAFANDPLLVLPVNAMLPHRLANLCGLVGARLIHLSTDCVFSGNKGNYVETDPMDASDLYGHSKFLGEVAYPHTITLRTSFIGHELETSHELLEWFLGQQGQVKGFTNAIYTGLPTIELAQVVKDIVLPAPQLSGIYHVASAPISKYDLLHLIAKTYKNKIEIIPDSTTVIDRSLDASRFNAATGYVAPPWPELVKRMYEFK